ncbi:hypothetical protein S7711_00477 [Stachybotrys chartarum IBT 7711]|uniref:Uncharacterized protein n=1 Tax=Stachybotrys chartarum (strain CBS 109288 / IBT 7711) TaxID=1280523 RepID=A0A084B9U2_STACB|nr:hypothetical protein S7711_00477 [Stachybotrys chartarum IBT 7711]
MADSGKGQEAGYPSSKNPLRRLTAIVQDNLTLGDQAKTRDDGRVDIHINTALYRTISHLVPERGSVSEEAPPPYALNELSDSLEPPLQPGSAAGKTTAPSFPISLNIVIQVVGSRGDVQPFVALGCALQAAGHRVRLATHNVFEDFVLNAGLEFYPIGGDPHELMAFMVKNPGLVPSMKSLRAGEVQKKRKMVAEMLTGCWESCVESDLQTGAPFVADAIIANPPSFAHVHCAQALSIPLHMMFTMPWTSTREFPHPLANVIVKGVAVNPKVANYLSYGLVEWMTWQGLGDVINEWRGTLDLEPVPTTEGPILLETLKVPFTYCWSPSLVPKPSDWASNIGTSRPPDAFTFKIVKEWLIFVDICGFFFREPPKYTPPKDLAEFLGNGPRPVYIGFGSIVIEDPKRMCSILLEAVRSTGARAIISKGWSKLGGDQVGVNEAGDVYFLGDCPHEWLFQHVSAVVHHGGAGTTACGLFYGRPTTIVPFFGDQPFWGDMVAAAGAGPKPIHHQALDAHNLAEAIRYCLSSVALAAAATLAAKIHSEKGVTQAVDSFHQQVARCDMGCDVLPNHPAVWGYKKSNGRLIKLSKLAAEVLSEHLEIDRHKLVLFGSKPIHIENKRWDPVTSTTSAFISTNKNMVQGATGIFVKPVMKYRSIAAQRTSGSDATQCTSETATPSTASPSHELSDGSQVPRGNKQDSVATTGAVAAASLSGLGGFFKSFGKGFVVDIPLATTEGLRNVPRLYGEQVESHEAITDWKSGVNVAGKNFVSGMAGGFSDLVTQPYKGAREGGVVGGAVGLGKGLLGFGTKVVSSPLGLVTYSFQGIYQSLRRLTSRTDHLISRRRMMEGEYLLRKARAEEADDVEDTVIRVYRELQ